MCVTELQIDDQRALTDQFRKMFTITLSIELIRMMDILLPVAKALAHY